MPSLVCPVQYIAITPDIVQYLFKLGLLQRDPRVARTQYVCLVFVLNRKWLHPWGKLAILILINLLSPSLVDILHFQSKLNTAKNIICDKVANNKCQSKFQLFWWARQTRWSDLCADLSEICQHLLLRKRIHSENLLSVFRKILLK